MNGTENLLALSLLPTHLPNDNIPKNTQYLQPEMNSVLHDLKIRPEMLTTTFVSWLLH